MQSVTQRIKSVKQPHGGYIKVKDFEKIVLEDGRELFPEENVHPVLVGLAVDYLTRYMISNNAINAFRISYVGATRIGKKNVAQKLINNINGLDNRSIISACKLAGFDVCFRANPSGYKPIEGINPDSRTIENIRIMVNRGLDFWKIYGPIEKDGITFEGGYTAIVSSGDGDYLTKDTIWDFKVSKNEPTSKHTLQLLMYYILGKHSVHSYFNQICYLGIFNPRLNKVYRYNINNLAQQVIEEVSSEVIGYGKSYDEVTNFVVNHVKADGLTIKETAKILGISVRKVRRLIKKGKLDAKKKGNRYRVRKSSINRYRRKCRQKKGIFLLVILFILLCVMIAIYINQFGYSSLLSILLSV